MSNIGAVNRITKRKPKNNKYKPKTKPKNPKINLKNQIKMVHFETYVFLDLETTGLMEKFNKPKITELAMIAIKAPHLSSSELGQLPRIMNKLVLSFDPQIPILPPVPAITGISNALLENDKYFDQGAVDLISSFIRRQPQPVCLVAHNGHSYDFVILADEIGKVSQNFGPMYCVDSLHFFRDIHQTDNLNSPKKQHLQFKLPNVYERTFGEGFTGAHCAETDTIALLRCCLARCQSFMNWTEENYKIVQTGKSTIQPLFSVN